MQSQAASFIIQILIFKSCSQNHEGPALLQPSWWTGADLLSSSLQYQEEPNKKKWGKRTQQKWTAHNIFGIAWESKHVHLIEQEFMRVL